MPAYATSHDDKYTVILSFSKNIVNAIDISGEQIKNIPCRVIANPKSKNWGIDDVVF
ncbi:MAG: hypothetical protein IPL73_24105 [Candidatus Obscuribacter sp.]|nr:hypothetical protein [Candidatus Obscuribacter sp.]